MHGHNHIKFTSSSPTPFFIHKVDNNVHQQKVHYIPAFVNGTFVG